MSYTEASEQTVLRFSRTWLDDLDTGRLVADFVSISNETNREPDTYYFAVKNRRLMDPESGKPVLDFVIPGVEREIAIDLENWANENDEGLAFWISPSLDGIYPCPKVILHRIAYTFTGEKVVRNSVILFDAVFDNPESLRRTLFTEEDAEENILGVLEWIKKISEENVIVDHRATEVREKARYFAGLVKNATPAQQIIQEMKGSGFIGPKPISCPLTFSRMVEGRANIHEGKFVRNCGKCGKEINKTIFKGYQCDCGGVYEGC